MTKVDLFLREPRHLRQDGRVQLFCKVLFSKRRVPIEELFHILLLHAHDCALLLPFSRISSAMEHQGSSDKVSQLIPSRKAVKSNKNEAGGETNAHEGKINPLGDE